MSCSGSSVLIRLAMPLASLEQRFTRAASSYATSSHRLPISMPITLLLSIPTSVMLVGSGRHDLIAYGPRAPSTVRVPVPKTTAGLQIGTVVEPFRGHEVPPAP